MKSSPGSMSESDRLIVDMTSQCNLFALNIGLDAARLEEKNTGGKVLADKVRSLAGMTVVLNSEGFHNGRYADMEETIVSLRDLAQKGRKFKDEVKKIRKI